MVRRAEIFLFLTLGMFATGASAQQQPTGFGVAKDLRNCISAASLSLDGGDNILPAGVREFVRERSVDLLAAELAGRFAKEGDISGVGRQLDPLLQFGSELRDRQNQAGITLGSTRERERFLVECLVELVKRTSSLATDYRQFRQRAIENMAPR